MTPNEELQAIKAETARLRAENDRLQKKVELQLNDIEKMINGFIRYDG